MEREFGGADRVVDLVVVGCGSRGTAYAGWAQRHPDRARVVAVADPRADRAEALARAHGLPREAVFGSWQELRAAGVSGDAVLVCTLDDEHVEPATAFLEDGWHVLLEKPMAPTLEECERIAAVADSAEGMLAVCHVLRYAPCTRLVKQLVSSGAIGEVMGVEHLEPVGWWHQAHSYVRGNWRRHDQTGSMLLAKSCHDLDWISHVVDQPVEAVASFGRLSHFTRENHPEGATDRCVTCPLQDECAYSATTIYLGRARRGDYGWPVDVLTSEHSEQAVLEALRQGPYGRCVYTCDNDVVDHQVVQLEFASGANGVFTMTAFTDQMPRRTRLFGTQGSLETDGRHVSVLDFRTGETVHRDSEAEGSSAADGHGGGDDAMMDAFVHAVATGDRSVVLSDARASLASHRIVFDAERARHDQTVVRRSPALG